MIFWRSLTPSSCWAWFVSFFNVFCAFFARLQHMYIWLTLNNFFSSLFPGLPRATPGPLSLQVRQADVPDGLKTRMPTAIYKLVRQQQASTPRTASLLGLSAPPSPATTASAAATSFTCATGTAASSPAAEPPIHPAAAASPSLWLYRCAARVFFV